MNVTDFQEVWQVDVGGQVYEASFEVMAQWVFEGSLLPQDLVRRGNLRWIEARKVPALLNFFNSKEQGMPPPVFASMTDIQATSENQAVQTQNFAPPQSVTQNSFESAATQTTFNSFQPPTNPFDVAQPTQTFHQQNAWQEPNFQQQPQQFNDQQSQNYNQTPSPDFCSMHANEPSSFVCETCGNGFCKVCPKSYGGNVKICPFCGAMCKSVKEFRQKTEQAFQYQAAVTQGFGIEDFFSALAYPFKFKISLFFGAVLFMFFTLGQSASSFGGYGIIAASFICGMMSNMLTFGVLANTVENFSQGKINLNFMPSFDDFDLWDDVVQPFFLFIGTYVVSFGLFFLIVAFVVWFSWTTFNGRPPVSLEDKINVAQKNLERQKSGEYQFNDDGTIKTGPGMKPEDLQDIEKIVREQRQKEIESMTGKSVEQEEADTREMVTNFMKMGVPAIAFAFLAFVWGLFYYPAACLVAGYTRSFKATLNPSVGWETIRILGWDYIKILLICIVLAVMVFAVSAILAFILSPFNMPSIGNLPAKAVGAFFVFYFSVVFAVVLGFALYKNSDKLNLFKG